jgi:hypothetical protein
VRPTRSGVVQIDLRLRLAELRPVELRISRAVGTRGMAHCPSPSRSRSRRFEGRLRTVTTVGALRPVAAIATVSGRRTVQTRLSPGLYRLTLRVRTQSGRLSSPAQRWLRVLAPR